MWLPKSSSPRAFSAASTNEIARRANFVEDHLLLLIPNEGAIVLAVIERRMTGIFRQVAASLPEEAPIEDTLRSFGAAAIRLALSKEQVALVRVVGMESAKFPELGKRFYELGPKRGEEALAAYLKKQAEKGRLSNEDARQMAQHFISLVQVVLYVGLYSDSIQLRWRKAHCISTLTLRYKYL